MKLFRRLRKRLPTHSDIEEYRYLHIFGDTLKQKDLWLFNRHTTSKGVAVGVFCAFLPMPFELVAAIFIASMIGASLPFAFFFVFISNPFTWVPLYTPCYLLGAKILGYSPIPFKEITIMQFGSHYLALWLGCLIVGTILAIGSHFLINVLWRSQIQQEWSDRKKARAERKQLSKSLKIKNKQSSSI